jgi:hypothetical protein
MPARKGESTRRDPYIIDDPRESQAILTQSLRTLRERDAGYWTVRRLAENFGLPESRVITMIDTDTAPAPGR